jgi:hypothetical protein
MTKTPRTSRANAKANKAARVRIASRKAAADAEPAAAAKSPRKNRRDAAIHARIAAAAPTASVDPNPIPIDVFGEAAELRAGADEIEAAREAATVPNPDVGNFAEALDQAIVNEVEATNTRIDESDTETSQPEAPPPTEPEPVPPETITRANGDMALVVDVGPNECTTLAARVAAMLGRRVLIVDMISLRTLQTVEPPVPLATTVGGGKARSVIVAACTRPEGATSKELFEATGWKYASWSHQLKIAAASGGFEADIRKIDGTTRYFLTKQVAVTPEPTTEPDTDSEAA